MIYRIHRHFNSVIILKTSVSHTVFPTCLYCPRMETVEGNVKLGGNPCKAKHSIGVMRRMLNLSLITKNDSSIILCPALGFYFDTKNAYKNSPDFYKFCFILAITFHHCFQFHLKANLKHFLTALKLNHPCEKNRVD